MKRTQEYAMRAWLGDGHGLDNGQVAELMRTSDEISERYPDADDQDLRDAALGTAYRLMIGDDSVVDEYAETRAHAKRMEACAMAALEQGALTLVPSKQMTEKDYAERAGVDRMTVRRRWFGKK
ncbi:hypothetical protein [Streptomyces sp. NPDC056304]|uniref:hypothetical protein n=1 Tax=Streptomyces sp. NPDC056304 TaxID=3345778 RepID=UPI0035E15791